MQHIYYFLTILLLCNELSWLTNIDKQIRIQQEFDENKDAEWKNRSEEFKTTAYMVFGICIWIFVGLFTSQWLLFVIYAPISISLSMIAKRYKYNNTWKSIHYVNSFIGVVFCIFLILNKYHLHIHL